MVINDETHPSGKLITIKKKTPALFHSAMMWDRPCLGRRGSNTMRDRASGPRHFGKIHGKKRVNVMPNGDIIYGVILMGNQMA